jgi:hypothetical protein
MTYKSVIIFSLTILNDQNRLSFAEIAARRLLRRNAAAEGAHLLRLPLQQLAGPRASAGTCDGHLFCQNL